jgi:hypothetical protein
VNVFDPNYKTPQYSAPANPPVTPVNNFNNQFGYSLVPIYIPGEGYRYFVVVPVDKWNYLNTNLIRDERHAQSEQKYEKFDKLNGRYNAKLKKYKAYEKALKPEQQPQQQQVSRPRRPQTRGLLHFPCAPTALPVFHYATIWATRMWHNLSGLNSRVEESRMVF